jgi:hypothetical protein
MRDMSKTEAFGGDPAKKSRDELLRISYEGELIGVALYTNLAAEAPPERQEPLVLLRDLEALTANAMEPLISEYGVIIDHDKARDDGNRLARQLAGVTWKQMWTDVTALADEYLAEFTALEKTLRDTHPAIGRQVVDHENALLEFARRELDDRDDSLEPLWNHMATYCAPAPEFDSTTTHEGN